jgi:signal transduction histidine kinase
MIRERLLWGFVLIALLPLLGVGLATSLVSYTSGRHQSHDRLESVAARKELAIRTWSQSLQRELQVVAQTDYSPGLVGTALRLANEGKRYDWYNSLVRKRLQALVGQSPQFEELFLLDLQGRVVVGTDAAREGVDYAATDEFLRALTGPVTRLPFGESAPVVAFVPYRAPDGQVFGIVAGRAPVDELLSILSERTGLGETGVARLAGPEGAQLAEAPAGGLPGNAVPARVVIGAVRALPDLQATLAVEQSAREALAAVFATIGVNVVIALVAVTMAVAAALWLTRSIADPITAMAATASDIAEGNLDRSMTVARADEIGALAVSFNSMTAQLRDLINSLEGRVDERTRALQDANDALERRALQLETSARVGRDITSILDLDDLLARVVDMIQDAFGYYHVQIFLLDRDARQLVLRAGRGPRSGEYRRLDLDQISINTRVAQTGAPVTLADVATDPGYLPDGNLPATRSELVVPLRLADQVIGTLDVHHDRTSAFTAEDALVIQSLGDQIAIAIENARLYDQSRELAILEERTRLARELHDSVTQSLYSVVLLSEGWRRQLITAGDAAPQPDAQLRRIKEIAQQALKEMRLLIYELRPTALDQDGLVDALRKRFDAVENRVGIEGRVVMGDLIDLTPAVAEGLYRIAQEALNNALKHAFATRATVRLFVEADHLLLEIEDDGRGFDVATAEGKGGMGIASMRDRTRQLGGELRIRSDIGAGTKVTVRTPLRVAAPALEHA